MPERVSLQVKCTVTGVLFQPFAFGGGLNEMAMAGGPMSMLNGPLVTDAVLPARSVAAPVTVWFGPSVVTTWSAGQTSMPEPLSLHVKCAVTGEPIHPPDGAGVSETAMTGLD